MAATIHIHHRHCYYYSAHKMSDTNFTVSRRVEGCVDLVSAVKVRNLCPRLYIAAAVTINTTAPWCGSNLGPLTPQSDALTTRLLRSVSMAATNKPIEVLIQPAVVIIGCQIFPGQTRNLTHASQVFQLTLGSVKANKTDCNHQTYTKNDK